MTRRRKKKLTAAKLVKAAAREQVGMPPATRRAPGTRKPREERHRKTLGRLLAEE